MDHDALVNRMVSFKASTKDRMLYRIHTMSPLDYGTKADMIKRKFEGRVDPDVIVSRQFLNRLTIRTPKCRFTGCNKKMSNKIANPTGWSN